MKFFKGDIIQVKGENGSFNLKEDMDIKTGILINQFDIVWEVVEISSPVIFVKKHKSFKDIQRWKKSAIKLGEDLTTFKRQHQELLDIMRKTRDIMKGFDEQRAYEYLVHSIESVEKSHQLTDGI